MVYRTNISQDIWNTLCTQELLSNRTIFSSLVYKWVSMKYVSKYSDKLNERIEVTFPSCLSNEERHTIHMFTVKNKLTSISFGDDDNRHICVLLSKKYIQELQSLENAHGTIEPILETMNTLCISSSQSHE